MDEFKKLAQEIRDEQRLKEIESSYGIPLLDYSLWLFLALLAIDLGIIAAKLLM